MSCILTRTTGRTWPNTRLPSRGSNNSLDSHCMKKERRDENVSRRILAGTHWERGPRCCPSFIVAALSRSKADDRHGNRVAEFHRAGFYGQLHGHTPCIDTRAPRSRPDLAAKDAENRLQNWQGRREIGRGQVSPHRKCC